MKETTLTILENTPLTHDTYRLRLAGDTSAITAPGQFVNLKLAGFFLRRPISVCDWTEGELTLIYKVLGRGTAAMTAFAPGAALSVLTGLGNGYDTSCSGERPLLVGGGVGIPPLYGLARRLRAEGKAVSAALGFHSAADVFLALRAGRERPHRDRRRERGSARPCHGRDGRRRGRLHLPLHLRPGADAPRRIRQVPHGRPVQL